MCLETIMAIAEWFRRPANGSRLELTPLWAWRLFSLLSHQPSLPFLSFHFSVASGDSWEKLHLRDERKKAGPWNQEAINLEGKKDLGIFQKDCHGSQIFRSARRRPTWLICAEKVRTARPGFLYLDNEIRYLCRQCPHRCRCLLQRYEKKNCGPIYSSITSKRNTRRPDEWQRAVTTFSGALHSE